MESSYAGVDRFEQRFYLGQNYCYRSACIRGFLCPWSCATGRTVAIHAGLSFEKLGIQPPSRNHPIHQRQQGSHAVRLYTTASGPIPNAVKEVGG